MSYYEDEYYDEYEGSYEWYEDNTEYSFISYLCRASNGHLYIERVCLEKPPGHDWGEAYTSSEAMRMSDCEDDWKEAFIRIGSNMENSSMLEIQSWWLEEFDDE